MDIYLLRILVKHGLDLVVSVYDNVFYHILMEGLCFRELEWKTVTLSSEGATVHGIDGPAAKELRRLIVFRGELESVVRWLSLIPDDVAEGPSDQDFAFVGLADAALLGFCRCFDLDHPLKPLKKKKMLSLDQRDELERIQNIRNKLVAHDAQLFSGVFSLIVRSSELTAIEAVSINFVTPFLVHSELNALRTLSQFVLDWVKQEYERVAREIVEAFNAMPAIHRAAASPFTINIQAKDHFAPKTQRGRQK